MKKYFLLVAMSFVLVFAPSAFASQAQSAHGQFVYVAASWQNITSHNQLTSSHLVIRNMDSAGPVVIVTLLFYDAHGQIARNLLDGQNGGPTSITLNPYESTSFSTNEATINIPRAAESVSGRPFWLVGWNSGKSGRAIIAPLIGGSIQILTPVSIFGSIGPPNYVVQSISNVEGVVLLQR